MAIHVGTSGWHYRHWVGVFYPEGMRPDAFLKFYLDRFDTVELNNSFYRLPTEVAVANWRDSVSADFKFAVKASRFITHNKKLKDSGESFQLFFERMSGLEKSLGPILFQLPPKWKYNGERLEEFLAGLPKHLDYVFEFRNVDWLRDDAFDLLRKYGVGFCIHDMPESRTPEIVTGKLAYVRFHGPSGGYHGSYPDAVLHKWADQFVEWHRKHINVYAYFNNDIGGHAPHNALTLLRFIAERNLR